MRMHRLRNLSGLLMLLAAPHGAAQDNGAANTVNINSNSSNNGIVNNRTVNNSNFNNAKVNNSNTNNARVNRAVSNNAAKSSRNYSNVKQISSVHNGVVESITPVAPPPRNIAPVPPPPGISEIHAPMSRPRNTVVPNLPSERYEPRAADSELNAYEEQVAMSLRGQLKSDLERYCMDYCSILTLDVVGMEHYDTGNSDLGFENVAAPSGVTRKFRVKKAYSEILVDSRYGSENIDKLQRVFERIIPRYNRPMSLVWNRVSFPENASTQKSEADVRKEFSTQVRGQIEKIVSEFCPTECRITGVNVEVDRASMDEAERGSVQRFLFARDGRGALFVKGVHARVNMNTAMDATRRTQISELMRESLLPFGAVSLDVSAVAFPKPAAEIQKDMDDARRDPYGIEKFSALMKLFKENMVGKEVYKETNTRETSGRETLDTRETVDTRELTQKSTKESELHANTSKQIDAIERVSEKGSLEALLGNKTFVWITVGIGLLLLSLIVFGWYWVRSVLRSPQMNAVLAQGSASVPHGMNQERNQDENIADNVVKEDLIDTGHMISRLEQENLKDECLKVFVAEPKIARETFTRIIKEDGVEETAKFVVIFGEIVIYELLKDLDLKDVLNQLADYVHLNAPQVKSSERVELLRQLKLKLTAAKMKLLTNRTLDVFDFLKAWSPRQILELTRDEPSHVQGVVLTQLSIEKRKLVFEMFGEKERSALLQALSKIDIMPREFLIGTAENMKAKATKSPKFDSENVRGTDVLLDLLASSSPEQQISLMGELDKSNPEAAWRVRSSLVTKDTLLGIADGALVDLMLDFDIREIASFLNAAKVQYRKDFFAKIPREIGVNWAESMDSLEAKDAELAKATEQKLVSKVRSLAAKGVINLTEINERILPRPEARGPATAPSPNSGAKQSAA